MKSENKPATASDLDKAALQNVPTAASSIEPTLAQIDEELERQSRQSMQDGGDSQERLSPVLKKPQGGGGGGDQAKARTQKRLQFDDMAASAEDDNLLTSPKRGAEGGAAEQNMAKFFQRSKTIKMNNTGMSNASSFSQNSFIKA